MMPLSNFSFPILTPHSLPHDNSSHIRLNGNENNFNNQTNIKPNKSIKCIGMSERASEHSPNEMESK